MAHLALHLSEFAAEFDRVRRDPAANFDEHKFPMRIPSDPTDPKSHRTWRSVAGERTSASAPRLLASKSPF